MVSKTDFVIAGKPFFSVWRKSLARQLLPSPSNYLDSQDCIIENGILRGPNEPYITTKYNSCGEMIYERLRTAPEFVGQVNGLTGEKESFAAMMEKSVKCAMWLKEQNVKPGDIIGICTHVQMDMYVPFFASLYIGAIANPWWDKGITRLMATHFLTSVTPKILFADEESAGLALEVAKELDIPLKVYVFGNLPGFESLDDILESQASKPLSEFQCTKLSSYDKPACILYTSGTTGLPKGAILSHRSVFANVNLMISMGKIEGATTILMNFDPLGWSTCVLCILRAVVERETRIVYPEFTEESTFQLIEKFKVNWMFVGMSAIIGILKSSMILNYDLSSLTYLYVVGEVLRKETQKAMASKFPQTKVLQCYGMTELGGSAIYETGDEESKLGSCGKPLKNIMIKVVDTKSGLVLGPNQSGEIYFKSPHMTDGYYRNPEATNELIDAEGWLHSGDLGYYDKEGSVFVTDRLKMMIWYRDYQVSPAMVEQVLREHSEVLEAAVVAKNHPIDGEHPMAFVVTKPNAQVTQEELQKLVANKLPNYMKLRGGIEFTLKLPRTQTGKIRKADLKKMLQAGKSY